MAPGDSLLELIRGHFNVRSLSELGGDGRPASRDELASGVAAAYVQWSENAPEPPPKRLQELRPVVATSAVSELSESAVLSRALLMCESSALVVPDSINYLGRLMRTLSALEGAIDAGAVVLLPDLGAYGGAHVAWQMLEAEMMGRLRLDDGVVERSKRAEAFVVAAEMAIAFDACSLFPDRLDLTCTRREQIELLRRWLPRSEAAARLGESHDRLRFVPDLLEVALPRFDLPLADLVAIREDGYFESWRRALEEGLEAARNLEENELVDPKSAMLREIRARVQSAADGATHEARRSPALRRALVGTAGFGIACATGALGALGGPEMGAAAGGAGFAGASVLAWLGERPREGARAFRRLVALFADAAT